MGGWQIMPHCAASSRSRTGAVLCYTKALLLAASWARQVTQGAQECIKCTLPSAAETDTNTV